MSAYINIDMPISAENIIDRLYRAGYEAFIVGGCVRDALLGRKAGDFDITTNARPDEVKALFAKTVDTGIQHGTVTVIENGEPYEVTTYRIDGEYADSRHPIAVSYTSNLTDDLARRDFTVNAMAYNHRVGIVDAFSGREDLARGILRAVGDPYLRFSEDALRILRCIRFSSVLGFDVEENTSLALREMAEGLLNVSKERIWTEWKKLIGGKNAYSVIKEYLDVITVFMPELSDLSLPVADRFMELDADLRMISLFASVGCKDIAHMAKRLRMESKIRDKAAYVLKNLITKEELTDSELKRFIIDNGDEISIAAAKVSYVIGKTSYSTVLGIANIIRSDHPRQVSQLSIDGRDLIAAGARGRDIGRLLYELLLEVSQGQLENDKDKLILRAQQLL